MPSTTNDFDLNSFYGGIYLFQKWEVLPGHITDGPKNVVETLSKLELPADLSGKRVLDIAPWNGFFSFECARRNASEVISFGPEDPRVTGFEQTRELLNEHRVRYVQGSVYDLSPAQLGTFDIVLFLGLIYHLRHPALALDRIHDICRDDLYCDSPVIDEVVYDKTVSEEQRDSLLRAGFVTNHLPMFYYTGGNETGDPYNWFIPNKRAFSSIVQSSGYDVALCESEGGWCWIKARKSTRSFVEGLEGYNPHAARR